MKKVLGEETVMHYLDHLKYKFPELQEPNDIIETLKESYRAQSAHINHLKDVCAERADAVMDLAVALFDTNPDRLKEVCKNNAYLSLLEEKGVFSFRRPK